MTQEDKDWLAALVTKVERISPPRLQHIEGPGFVMLGKRPEPQPWFQKSRHLFLGAAGGLIPSCIAVAVILWLVNT